MKKLMLLLMSLVLCLGLAACANTNNKTPGTVDDNGTVVNDTNNGGLLNETKDDLKKDMNDINNDKLNNNNNSNNNVTP